MNGSPNPPAAASAPLTPYTLNLIPGAAPEISFVIPLFNCLGLTQACVASLQATVPPGLSHEIILIDDGSTDGTRDWLATLRDPPFRVVLNERNLGYAISNNRAAALARGRYLILLNNDLLLPDGWLEPLLDAHRHLGSRAGFVGNVQLDAKSGSVDHAGIVINVNGKPVHVRSIPSRLRRWLSPVREIPAVTGACVLVECSLWRQLAGFDERYLNGGEDIDFCFRSRAIGRVNVVALRSVVRHHVSSSTGRKLRDEENSYLLARRWRREFLACADVAARDWCRDYLAAALVEPRSAEYALALRALLHLLRLRKLPPPESLAGIETNLAREFACWEDMFGKRG